MTEELFLLFFPGYIFVHVYERLFKNKMESNGIILWSLFVANIIKATYSVLHQYFFKGYIFDSSLKILMCTITGFLLPYALYAISRGKIYKYFLMRFWRKTPNQDILDDAIDFNKATWAEIYLKNSRVFYIGKIALMNNEKDVPYLLLIKYEVINKKNGKIVSQADQYEKSLLICTSDIERIEFTYEQDSDVWKSFLLK